MLATRACCSFYSILRDLTHPQESPSNGRMRTGRHPEALHHPSIPPHLAPGFAPACTPRGLHFPSPVCDPMTLFILLLSPGGAVPSFCLRTSHPCRQATLKSLLGGPTPGSPGPRSLSRGPGEQPICPASWGAASAPPPGSRQQALDNLPSRPPRGCAQPVTQSFIPVQNKVYSASKLGSECSLVITKLC